MVTVKRTFSQKIKRTITQHPVRCLVAALVIIFLIGQTERLIHKGTLLGYQVRSVKNSQAVARQNSSGEIVGGSVSKDNKKSVACGMFSADKIGNILGGDVERISGFVPDTAKPLVSSCIYRTKAGVKPPHSASMLLREQKDESAAKKTMDIFRQSNQGKNVDNLGDEAYFNTSANQLTVRTGKRLLTVTVPGSYEGKDNKTMASEIAKLAL